MFAGRIKQWSKVSSVVRFLGVVPSLSSDKYVTNFAGGHKQLTVNSSPLGNMVFKAPLLS